MGQALETSIDAQWDDFTSGQQPDTEVDTEAAPVDEQDVETTDEAESTDDAPSAEYETLQSQIAQLNQTIQQQQVWMSEQLRRTAQSVRDVGNSIVERVEQRLAQAKPILANQVQRGLLTPEDAQAQLVELRGEYTSEEAQRAQAERAQAERQAWLASQQPQAQGGTYSPAEVQRAQDTIASLINQSGLSPEEIRAYGVPNDLSHLSPIEAVETARRWLVATMQAKRGNTRNGGRQFPFPNMGGGAGVAARGMEGITKEIEAEMSKELPDFERIAVLKSALTKQLAPR